MKTAVCDHDRRGSQQDDDAAGNGVAQHFGEKTSAYEFVVGFEREHDGRHAYRHAAYQSKIARFERRGSLTIMKSSASNTLYTVFMM